MMPGEFEDRFKAVLQDVAAQRGRVILFIDDIHNLVPPMGQQVRLERVQNYNSQSRTDPSLCHLNKLYCASVWSKSMFKVSTSGRMQTPRMLAKGKPYLLTSPNPYAPAVDPTQPYCGFRIILTGPQLGSMYLMPVCGVLYIDVCITHMHVTFSSGRHHDGRRFPAQALPIPW